MRLMLTASQLTASTARRIIAGRIVTWNEVGHTSAGPTRFAAGSIAHDGELRLLLEHDHRSPLGRALELTEHDKGIDGTFRVVGTRAGDDALVEASEQLRDGLSVGVNVVDSHRDDDGVLVVTLAELDEVSLVSTPAIDSARVERVAASNPTPSEEDNMTDQPIEVEVEETVEETAAVESVEASRPAPVIRTTPRVQPFSSPADYILTSLKAAQGDSSAAVRLTAAVQDQKLAGNTGIVPEPIIGNVIDTTNAGRPIIDAARRLPMPAAGKSFERPIITQHTSTGVQATELAVLDSSAMVIDPITVNKSTVGGTLRISFQDRDWTDPALLNIVVEDMLKHYAIGTEELAAGELTSGSTGTQSLAASATSDVVVKALYDAAAKVLTATGKMPDTLYAAPDQWARLGSLVDGNKRPLFPSMAPSNALGTMGIDSLSGNPLGVRLVVSQDLAAGSLILGRSEYHEVYENGPAQVSATDPSVLGFTLAVYGYFANKVTVGGAFVKLAPGA